MPTTTVDFWTPLEAAVILFYDSRGAKDEVIERILWEKLGVKRSSDDIRDIVHQLKQQLRENGFNNAYNDSTKQWDRHAVDRWLGGKMPLMRLETVELTSIDQGLADAIEGVSIRVSLRTTLCY